MLSKAKRLTGLAATALAVSAALPAAPAGAALGPCTAVAQSTGSEVAVVVEGDYVDNKWLGNVSLTCHLVQNGVTVASIKDPLIGPVATLASDQRLGTDPFHVCYSVHIGKPFGGSVSFTNC